MIGLLPDHPLAVVLELRLSSPQLVEVLVPLGGGIADRVGLGQRPGIGERIAMGGGLVLGRRNGVLVGVSRGPRISPGTTDCSSSPCGGARRPERRTPARGHSRRLLVLLVHDLGVDDLIVVSAGSGGVRLGTRLRAASEACS